MVDFPHLNDTVFPDADGVDVYKYRNQFDYSRFGHTQMKVTLCSVPWDMGEAHIGNRTISGIGNVVWFGTEAARDAWFTAIPDNRCIRLETKYKELHRDNQIMLPVPFDVACQYNYLMVEYEPFANAESLVQYETASGLDKWFWFVREVEFVSPNTTRVHLLNDAFQTFMYRIDIGGMILERGHAPLFGIDVDNYLSNPLANNSGLLAEDVNYGYEPSHVTHTGYHVFNDDNYAIVACTSSPTSNWGSKANNDWRTPALASYTVDGVPDVRMFAIDVAELNTFLQAVESDYPQFKQTVRAVFFAPKELVTLGNSFEFAGVVCSWVSTSKQTIDLLQLDKSQFHYPARYADLAKLYTSPYAHIEVTDENGNINVIRIEDTNGNLRIGAALSLAFPAINIQAHLFGYGGIDNTAITFANITNRSLTIGGKWYETLHTWEIPLFGIYQSSAKQNDYSTHFDREQQRIAYGNAYDSTTASASTAKTNSDAGALTDRDNAIDSANVTRNNAYNAAHTMQDNALLQTQANDQITTANNLAATNNAAGNQGNAEIQITANNAFTAQANNFIDNTTNAQIDATLQSAAVSAASGVLTSGISAVASAASGNPVGAISSIAGGIVNAGAAAGQAVIATNLDATQAYYSKNQNDQKRITSNNMTADLADVATSNNTVNNTTKNNLITSTNANQALQTRRNANNAQSLTTGGGYTYTDAQGTSHTGTLDGTAPRSYATATANNQRTYDTDTANAARTRNTAQNAITNQISQAALGAPYEFGTFANNAQATTKPVGLFTNIVTQTKSAIAQAGDEFLRYGYYYNRQWTFDGDWNIGKHFTYWKLKDFWVRGLNVPDMYVDKLRFFLFGGVTVWRRPEDIGSVSIYDNWL